MVNESSFTLAHCDTVEIEALWRALAALPARSRVVEEHIASESLRMACEPMLGQPAWIVATLLEAVLAERQVFAELRLSAAIATPALRSGDERASPAKSTQKAVHATELVWSGATAARTCARSTRQAIEDLFGAAQQEVFVAGYSFDHASDLFAPLFANAASRLAQGLALPKVRIVLDCSRKHVAGALAPDEIARRVYDDFLRTCWQESPIVPEVRYLRESAERSADNFARCSMHAKCIIVDRSKALVGSANFSNRGRDRNLEVGALVSERHFVASLCAEWDALWPRLLGLSVED
jgi:phosphatidylserine/phosphatidylglycerophosphate/cardiolipin synthase-like enzyme